MTTDEALRVVRAVGGILSTDADYHQVGLVPLGAAYFDGHHFGVWIPEEQISGDVCRAAGLLATRWLERARLQQRPVKGASGPGGEGDEGATLTGRRSVRRHHREPGRASQSEPPHTGVSGA
jgi:hypothetical protein